MSSRLGQPSLNKMEKNSQAETHNSDVFYCLEIYFRDLFKNMPLGVLAGHSVVTTFRLRIDKGSRRVIYITGSIEYINNLYTI